MKKTLKTTLIITLALLALVFSAVSASAASATVMPEYDIIDLDLHNHSATYFYVYCYGDYSTIGYTSASDYYTVSFMEWEENGVAVFYIQALDYGDGYAEFTVKDAAGNVLDSYNVEILVHLPWVLPEQEYINVITGGCNPVTVPVTVPVSFALDEYTIYYEKNSDNISVEWGEWVGNSIGLKIWPESDSATDCITISLYNQYDEYLGEDYIFVYCDDQYYAGPSGDMNLDGKITVEDARACLRAAIYLDDCPYDSAPFSLADTDGDGELTVMDARTILRRAIGFYDAPYYQYALPFYTDLYSEYQLYDGYAFADIDRDGILEMLLRVPYSDGSHSVRVMTLNYYGNVINCGEMGDVKLSVKDGRLYASTQGGSSQTVWLCELTDKKGLKNTMIRSTTTGQFWDPGEELTFYPMDDLSQLAALEG